MALQIVQAGDPVLRQRARPLSAEEITGSEIQQLIEEMREAMRTAPGVGLAAPQIGRSLQLAVIEDRAEYHKDIARDQLREKERKPVPFYVLINPEIVRRSEEYRIFFEGCLSLGGFCAMVPRSVSVTVNYLNEHGARRSLEATGWHARIIQHEVDHLQGALYIDRMQTRTFTTLDSLTQYWKNLRSDEVLAKLK
jgi:peptide deformylase